MISLSRAVGYFPLLLRGNNFDIRSVIVLPGLVTGDAWMGGYEIRGTIRNFVYVVRKVLI